MKANPLVWVLLLLVLGCGCNKQRATPAATNQTATNVFDQFNVATNGVVGGETIEEIKAKAEKGNAEAQFKLGVKYFNGKGVPKDISEAVKWYRKAAEQGYAAAQASLGKCYYSGEGVTMSHSEAVKWYRKVAEQGDADAQCLLGLFYEHGEGVPKDFTEAAGWYRKSAEQNNAEAQCELGLCYAVGRGVAKDKVEAVKWFHKAAEQNDANAQLYLGSCYANGDGVAVNLVEAAKWFRKSAEQGNAHGEHMIGLSYELGNGVTKDYVEAYKWLNLAASQGDEEAKPSLSRVEEHMTVEQIAEAQQLAREFRPHKASGSDESNSSPNASGTGFFITDDGYLISNYHVVKDAAKIRLVTSAGTIDAKVVQVDAANDLALLKAEGKFSSLPIAASRTAHLGGTVATIGFPDPTLQGFSPKLAKGEIASLSGASDNPRYFQISVPVQPGNSGGALVDERGNVIGIVSAKLSARAALAASGSLPENVNYAVKSSFLLSFLESVPDVSAKLKSQITVDRKFEDVVKSAQDAAVLVLVY